MLSICVLTHLIFRRPTRYGFCFPSPYAALSGRRITVLPHQSILYTLPENWLVYSPTTCLYIVFILSLNNSVDSFYLPSCALLLLCSFPLQYHRTITPLPKSLTYLNFFTLLRLIGIDRLGVLLFVYIVLSMVTTFALFGSYF